MIFLQFLMAFTTAGFILSLLAHLSLFFGVTPQAPLIWGLFVPVLPIWLFGYIYSLKLGDFGWNSRKTWEKIMKDWPEWMKIVSSVVVINWLFNLLSFIYLDLKAGGTKHTSLSMNTNPLFLSVNSATAMAIYFTLFVMIYSVLKKCSGGRSNNP